MLEFGMEDTAMSDFAYPRFCPTAMAASLLEPRWTMLVLCEMWNGSTRFSEIQRGVPGMSPALLSKRLKEMEANSLITRRAGGGHGEYITTPMADELEPIIRSLAEWAHRNIDSSVTLQDVDHRMLMWNIRRKVDLLELPRRRCVIQFILRDPSREPVNYWIVARPGEETDLCIQDPRYDVDLFITCDLRALASAWMGHTSFNSELSSGRMSVLGDDLLARTMTRWLVQSSFASVTPKADGSLCRKTV